MMRPSADIIRTYGVPREVVAQAYTENPRHRQETVEALRKVRELCEELGIVRPVTVPLWRALGVWDAAPA
jgi:hypothetical protein